MSLFSCLKWPEMRPVTLELINSMHEGHARGRFSIPVLDFVRVFAPGAGAAELEKVKERGDIQFTPDGAQGGTFRLAEGPRATFEMGREGLAMRVPERMSGRYTIRPSAFRILFNSGEELEGCKRILMLICHRVISVDVSSERVDVRLPGQLFNLCVEFE
jgi:hypothetical protein